MNKQDEEKANILSREISQEYDSKEYVGYDCALKMAAWKEQQMIEKASLFFIDAFKELPNGYGTFKIKRDCSIEQLIEDFKKAMED